MFAGGAWFVATEWNAASRSRVLIDHSRRVIETTLTSVKEMVDAETAQRGFLITGDAAYLAPLEAARISIPQRFKQLAELGADEGSHRPRFQRMAALWDEKLGEITQSIERMRAGDAAGARSIVAAGSGKALMNEIRAEADRLQSEERTLLTERLAASDRSRDSLGIAVSVLVVLAGIGMVFSVLALSRRTASLARDVQSQRRIARTLEEAAFELAGEVTSVRAELTDTALRFNAALRTAPIVITSQDKDLRYLWMRNSLLGLAPDSFIGKTDAEVMPEPARSRMIAMKKEAIRSGEARNFEINLPNRSDPEGSWYDVHVEPTRNKKGAIDGVTAVAMDVTERRRRERHVRLLMRELAHRSKNTLAVTQAMARQTAATTSSMDEFLDRFADRLDALGRAHSLLVNEGWAGAAIEDLVRSQLGHYADLINRQIFLDGPRVTLPTAMIQSIGLALHELATNAAKYGALSTPQGRVDIVWQVDPHPNGTGAVRLRWVESGGPPVSPPERRGFGQIVIERTVARAVSGEVDLDYRPEGLIWELRFDRPPEENGSEAPPHSAATA
jgi:PAS domain S-box-containing protein